MLGLSFETFARENLDLASATHAAGLVDDSALEVAETFLPEAIANVLQKRRPLTLETKDVALIQPVVAGFPAIGLAQNAADELRQRGLRTRVRQHREHVGERTIPALLKRLL